MKSDCCCSGPAASRQRSGSSAERSGFGHPCAAVVISERGEWESRWETWWGYAQRVWEGVWTSYKTLKITQPSASCWGGLDLAKRFTQQVHLKTSGRVSVWAVGKYGDRLSVFLQVALGILKPFVGWLYFMPVLFYVLRIELSWRFCALFTKRSSWCCEGCFVLLSLSICG